MAAVLLERQHVRAKMAAELVVENDEVELPWLQMIAEESAEAQHDDIMVVKNCVLSGLASVTKKRTCAQRL